MRTFVQDIALLLLHSNIQTNIVYAAVIITDGNDANLQRTATEASNARGRGVHIYAVGVGVPTNQLSAIGSVPSGRNVFAVQSFGELVSLPSQIFSNICPGMHAIQSYK